MLYAVNENIKQSYKPISNVLEIVLKNLEFYEKIFHETPLSNLMQAQSTFLYQLIKDYPKPHFNYKPIEKEGLTYNVLEEVVKDKTFCEFKKFSLEGLKRNKAVLVVIPLSGHYATLLKDTIKSILFDYDVFITDWKNAKEIPKDKGDFGFEDYVKYVIELGEDIKAEYKKLNVVAVCQPTVPVMTAAAYYKKINKKDWANNIVLMGGPVDTRISPTQVNNYALKKDINWFKNHVIHTVPNNHEGRGRKVYPGFLQYSGFLSMNMKRHTQAHLDFFNHLLIGADLDAKKHQEFYNEYNAVMDLAEKYYLETLERVFIDQHLAKGTMKVDNKLISLNDIKDTKLLTIEGEMDDISGLGQTHAANYLCTNIPQNKKEAITFEGVGHYGIFAGKKWRNEIYSKIKNFIEN